MLDFIFQFSFYTSVFGARLVHSAIDRFDLWLFFCFWFDDRRMEVPIFLKCCVNVNSVLKYVGVVKSLPECIEMWEMSVEVQIFFFGISCTSRNRLVVDRHVISILGGQFIGLLFIYTFEIIFWGGTVEDITFFQKTSCVATPYDNALTWFWKVLGS